MTISSVNTTPRTNQDYLKNNWIILVSFIGFLIAYAIIRCLILLSSNPDYQGIEQNVVYSTQMLLSGNALYQSPGLRPFSITQYMPLYYYLLEVTMRIFDYGADDIKALYLIGRSWSLVFNFISAFLVFRMALDIFKLKSYQALLLAFFTLTFVFLHNAAVRPDSMHDMFGIASIYLFFLYLSRGKPIYLLVIAISLSMLSVLSKQSGIQFIVIIGGCAILLRDWKTLLRGTLISCAIYIPVLYGLFHYHDFFVENVIGGVSNGISMWAYYKYVLFSKIFMVTGIPIILLFLFLSVKKRFYYKEDNLLFSLWVCVLGTFLFATLTALKMGATAQYYLIFVILCLLLVVKTFQNNTRLVRLFFLYCLVSSTAFLAQHIRAVVAYDYDANSSKIHRAAENVIEFLSQNLNDGDFFYCNLSSDRNLYNRNFINNVLFEKAIVPQRDILLASTGPMEVFGYDSFENSLLSGSVKYIIDSDPNIDFQLSENFNRIKAQHFKLIKKIDGYLIYEYSANN